MDFINQIHNVHRTAVLILYFICSALNGIFYISKSNKHYKIEEETYAKMIDQMKEKFHADVDWENVDDFQTKSLREIYKVAHTYCLLAQKKWCILTNINTILNRKRMNPRNWPNIWHPILCLRMRATMNQCLRRYLICKIETILFVYWLCCNLTFFSICFILVLIIKLRHQQYVKTFLPRNMLHHCYHPFLKTLSKSKSLGK